jgi:hypothetical protein
MPKLAMDQAEGQYVPAGACRSSREINSRETVFDYQTIKRKMQERKIAEDDEWNQAECA